MLTEKLRFHLIASRIGIPICAASLVLDYVLYPESFTTLALLRGVIILYLLFVLYAFPRVSAARQDVLALAGFFIVGVLLTLQAYVTGLGFGSVYFIGHIILITLSPVAFSVPPRAFFTLLTAIYAQHFIILSFLPFTFGEFMINFVSLSVAFGVGAFIQYTLSNLLDRIRTLEGFITICAHCKDVRNDAGDWQLIEEYVRDHSEAEFTHGICPGCLGEHFPEAARRQELRLKSV